MSVPELPSLERYLAELPAGLASYPEALVKATGLVASLRSTIGAALRECRALPAPLRALLDDPPMVSAWVSSAKVTALEEAAFDVYFVPRGGLAAHDAFVVEANRAVFKGPLHRILFAAISPERLVSSAASRWAAFHRGSTLEAVERGPGRAAVELTHPPALFTERALRAHGTAIGVAVELTGARDLRTSIERRAPGTTRYTMTWR